MTVAEILAVLEPLEPALLDLVKKGVDAITARRSATTRADQIAAERALGEAAADAAELEVRLTK